MLKQIFKQVKNGVSRARDFQQHIMHTARHTKKPKLQVSQKNSRKKAEPAERVIVEFSLYSVVKCTIVVLLLLSLVDFISYIKEPIYILLMSFFLAAIFDPMVDALEQRKIPRSIGIIGIYIMVLGILFLVVLNLVPVLFDQVTGLASNIGKYINNILIDGDYPFAEKIRPIADQILLLVEREQIIVTIQNTLSQIGSELKNLAGDTVGVVVSLFSDLLNMIFVLVITFFIVIDKAEVKQFFLSLFPHRHGQYITDKIQVVQKKIGEWVRGQLLLCLSIAVLTFIGLSILGVDYALTLALVAGITEIIPYIGPIIAYLAALPITLNDSPLLALWTTILYIIIQQAENNILVPLIMNKTVGLSPVVIMLAMLIGAKIFGVIGIILAVPVATTAAIFIHDYTDKTESQY